MQHINKQIKIKKARKKKDIRIGFSKKGKDFKIDCNFGCTDGAAFMSDFFNLKGEVVTRLDRMGYDVATIKFSVNKKKL